MASNATQIKNTSRRATAAIQRPLAILISASAVLLIVWSFAVPIFEVPDEETHWQHARYIHDYWRLPIYGPAMWEGNQPPVYYWLVAPVAKLTTLPTSQRFVDRIGNFIFPCAPRFYDDCLADFRKYWPLRWARVVTALLSVVTVLFTYFAAREATGKSSVGLLAGCLTACLPQFTFRGSHVNNDAMAATSCAIVTYFLILLIRRDFSWRTASLASLSLAVAFLSKINAVIFVPMLLFVLLSGPGTWRLRLKRTSVLLIAAVCVTPWLIRNKILYGDLLASKAMLTAVPIFIDKKPLSSPYFLHFFPEQLAKSFVGVFGGMNVYMAGWIYWIFGTAALLAAGGFVLAAVRRVISLRLVVVLTALPLLAIAATVQLNLMVSQPQGRYLFPALSAMMIAAAIGFDSLPKWNLRMTYGVIALFAAINLYALLWVEVRTYWLPYSGPKTVLAEDVEISWTLMTSPAGPLVAGSQFGQTFVAKSNLAAVEVEVATYGRQIPTGIVRVHLRSSPQADHDLASTVIPAHDLTDNGFARLTFPPLPDSDGKSYYVLLEADGIPAGYPLTVWTSKGRGDVYPQGRFFVDGRATGYDTSLRAFSALACTSCGRSLLGQSQKTPWHGPW